MKRLIPLAFLAPEIVRSICEAPSHPRSLPKRSDAPSNFRFSALYPFNSINAFNLYAVFSDFFRSDTAPVLGIPLMYWGYALFLITFLVVAERYIRQARRIAYLLRIDLLPAGDLLPSATLRERLFDARD